MSLNELNLNIQKPWLNARVQDLTVDGTASIKDLSVNDLTANSIETNTLNANSIITDTIVSRSSITETLEALDIHTNTLNASSVSTDTFDSNTVVTGSIEAVGIITTDLESDSINSTSVISTNINVDNIIVNNLLESPILLSPSSILLDYYNDQLVSAAVTGGYSTVPLSVTLRVISIGSMSTVFIPQITVEIGVQAPAGEMFLDLSSILSNDQVGYNLIRRSNKNIASTYYVMTAGSIQFYEQPNGPTFTSGNHDAYIYPIVLQGVRQS